MKTHQLIILASLTTAALLGTGCASRHSVLAATGTSIGVDISQNPQTQMYQAKLGYHRGEMAIVPSNRSAKEDPGTWRNGATDTADVLMELKYGGIFNLTNSGIYQRLAVGKEAVRQPGAAFLLAKDAQGNLDPAAARAVGNALAKVPAEAGRARVEALNGVMTYLKALPENEYPTAKATADGVDASLGRLVPNPYNFDAYSINGNVITKTPSPAPPAGLPAGYPKFKHYLDTLKSSIRVLGLLTNAPTAFQIATAANPAGVAIVPADVDTAKADLEAQNELLKVVEQRFVDDEAVQAAFNTFADMTTNEEKGKK